MPSLKQKIFPGDRVVLATHNKGKILEFRTLLSKFRLKILTSEEISIDDVDETGKTFKENAVLKVKSIPDQYLSISDDSGLCVNSLNNRPGIFSSRFQKKCGGWYEAMNEIYKEVKVSNKNDFSAYFVCCIAVKFSSDAIFTYEGKIKGQITWPPTGKNGFGYDPFFVPDGYNQTFGEMNHIEKIQIDHRSIAIKMMLKSHLGDN